MIYVVEDDRALRASVLEYLRHAGHDVEGFETAEEALEAAASSPPDVAICDLQLPGKSGLELVEELAELDGSIVRILVTAHASARTAVRAIRAGCYEYLEKPVDMAKLERLAARALDERRNERELAWLRADPASTSAVHSILGESDAMRSTREQIQTFAGLGAKAPPVLITGETGVGKGMAARALHDARFGRNAPFIAVNCAALPGTLVEAELFGYEKSAFTDARQAKPGLFEVAGTGTIFLDEIGEFSPDFQAKLLTVLESQVVRRLGSVRDRNIACSVIAASNRDLKKASEDGSFRADLYHRIAALTIDIPALRDRGDDAVMLARSFCWESATRYGKSIERLSPEAEAAIRQYSWPGNVRELRFAVERATILAPRTVIELPVDHLAALTASAAPRVSSSSGLAAIDATAGRVRVELPAGGVSFDELERAILRAALDHTGGNVTHAARFLSIGRDQMRYRIRKYDLD